MSEVWFPWLSAGITAVIVARWSWIIAHNESRRFTDIIGAALIVLAWHSSLWGRIAQGYAEDTLYNLTVTGRFGLLALTVFLVLMLLSLSQLKSRWLQQVPRSWTGALVTLLTLDLFLTFLLFVVALTVVPQLYYSYYLLLFDNLSPQWVIKLPSFETKGRSLRMASDAGSSLHAIGFTGWWLLVLVVLGWIKNLQLASPVWRLVGITVLANLAWHFFA